MINIPWKSRAFWLHAAVLLALALPYFINLGASSIWDANEAFYAETPREMLESGNYIAPHFNYQPRVQKPPLTYWAVLLSYKIFGIHEFAVRLPGALAALGILLLCYALARSLFTPRAALFAAAIAGTTARIFILQRRLPIDILLLFFLTGALYFLIRALLTGSRAAWACAYAFAALGFLTKGPVAVFIPAAACLAWMLCSRRLKFSALHLLPGSLLFLCLALPYYVLVYQAYGWTYIAPFFLSDNVGRFASETLGPSRGLFYYVSVYASDFFPWSFIGLMPLHWLWRHRRIEQPLRNTAGILLCWCAVIFVFFSLSKNKQEYYIAPMFPAAAVLLGGVLDKMLAKKRAAAAESLPESAGAPGPRPAETPAALWMGVHGLVALLLLALALLLPYILRSIMPGSMPALHYAPTLCLMAGAAWMAVMLARRNFAQSFLALAASLWILFVLSAWLYVPALEAFRPVKSFCARIAAQGCFDAGDEAGVYRASLPSMTFYLRRPVFYETSPEAMARRFQSGRRIFCILSGADYDYFIQQKLPLRILDRRPHFSVRFGNLLGPGNRPAKELLLVSNQSYSTIPCH